MAKKKQTQTKAESAIGTATDMEVVSKTGVTMVTDTFVDDTEVEDAYIDNVNLAIANQEEQDAQEAHNFAHGTTGNGRVHVIGDGGTGDHAPQPTNMVVIEIDPENIIIDPDLRALRSWSGHSEQELALPDLARTLYEEGQQYPVLMYQTEDGLVLYEGHRRREASIIIREEWDATWMLKAVVNPDMTADRALRMACLADSQHKKFTATEVAHNIAFLRKHFNWTGGEHTSDVADFLGVSPATITEMERYAKAPAELKAKVDAGRLTVSGALDAIAATSNIAEEERPAAIKKVVDKAGELAEADAKKKKEGKEKRTPVTREQAAIAKRTADAAKKDREAREARQASGVSTPEPEPIVDVATEPAKPAPITGKHIRQAARQVLPEGKIKAPKMSEAVELIEPWSGPAYPEVLGALAGTFADYGRGKATDKQLEAAWDDVADALAGKKPKSKPAPTAKKAAPAAKKAAVKKTAPAKKVAAAAAKKGKPGKPGKQSKK